MAEMEYCIDEGRKRAGRRFVRTVCLSFLTVLAVAGFGQAESGSRPVVNCDIQQGPCTRLIDGRRVTLDVQPKPVRAMTDLTFAVTIESSDEKTAAHIELDMPAMDMGQNHVVLKRNEKGVFVGKGIIVRCRSGIRTWRANVVVDDLGTAAFIFDVDY